MEPDEFQSEEKQRYFAHYEETLQCSFNQAFVYERLKEDDLELDNLRQLKIQKGRKITPVIFGYISLATLGHLKLLNKYLGKGFHLGKLFYYSTVFFTSNVLIGSLLYDEQIKSVSKALALKYEPLLLEQDEHLRKIFNNYRSLK